MLFKIINMKEDHKSVFIRIPEDIEMPSTKKEIVTGISSKDINEKILNFNYLLIKILNDPYQDQLLMLVINKILPYQNKSSELKKMLLIYWEIV